MPRDGAIIFGDLIGKLDLLRIECPKCGRSGQYRLADLISRYGRDEKLFAFTADVTENCTRKQRRKYQHAVSHASWRFVCSISKQLQSLSDQKCIRETSFDFQEG